MFTGIIESMGEVVRLDREGTNLHIRVKSALTNELKIDQSLAHNGVCLTVVGIEGDTYTVTAVAETLKRSNLGTLTMGSKVNLERAMVMGARLDGHLVQGHVDQTATCVQIDEENGSWAFHFEYNAAGGNRTIPKGSITVDGVSLTVVDSQTGRFSVAIIPYTYEHTRFGHYQVGDPVNLEFDMIGKYVAALVAPHLPTP